LADDHLIDFHLDRLLNCVSDRLAIALAGMAIFMNSRKFFLVASSELLSDSSVAIAPGEIIVQRIFLGVQFHPQPFSQRAHSRLGGAVDRPAGGEHFDPKTEAMLMM